MRCPVCVEHDLRSTVPMPSHSFTTAMAGHSYYDENGTPHNHDPNTTTTRYCCSLGHEWVETQRRGCLSCGSKDSVEVTLGAY